MRIIVLNYKVNHYRTYRVTYFHRKIVNRLALLIDYTIRPYIIAFMVTHYTLLHSLIISSCTFKIFSTPPNIFKILKILFDYISKITNITIPKYITGSRLSEVKIYYRKSTFRSKNILPDVDFRKSKYITRSRLRKLKIYYRKSTSGGSIS